MDIRYYNDADTGLPHIYGHGVTEAEVEWVLTDAQEDEPCSGSRGRPWGRRQKAGICVWFTCQTRTKRAYSLLRLTRSRAGNSKPIAGGRGDADNESAAISQRLGRGARQAPY